MDLQIIFKIKSELITEDDVENKFNIFNSIFEKFLTYDKPLPLIDKYHIRIEKYNGDKSNLGTWFRGLHRVDSNELYEKDPKSIFHPIIRYDSYQFSINIDNNSNLNLRNLFTVVEENEEFVNMINDYSVYKINYAPGHYRTWELNGDMLTSYDSDLIDLEKFIKLNGW